MQKKIQQNNNNNNDNGKILGNTFNILRCVLLLLQIKTKKKAIEKNISV